jgi:predicted nucleic acid-binding protein
MAASPKKTLALDANVLMDLAEEKDFAHEFREQFQHRGYNFFVPPTVLAELDLLSLSGRVPQSDLANLALERLGGWGCHPFALSSTGLVIAQRFSARLLEMHLIPEGEQNDGKILAQASLAEIPMLVTSDKHLLDIDDEALMIAFNEADLSPVHPRRLVDALR